MTIAQRWSPSPAMPKIAAGAGTGMESMQRTMVHELGHHLLAKVPDNVRQDFSSRFGLGRHVTEYAADNVREYVAESFAAMIFEPQLLNMVDMELELLLVDSIGLLRG